MQQLISPSPSRLLAPQTRSYFTCLEDWAVVQGVTLLIHLDKNQLDSKITVSPGYLYDSEWLFHEATQRGIAWHRIHQQVLVLKQEITDMKWLWFPRIWGVEESASLLDGLAYIQRKLRFNLKLDVDKETVSKPLGLELFSEDSGSRSLERICKQHGLVLQRITDLTYGLGRIV